MQGVQRVQRVEMGGGVREERGGGGGRGGRVGGIASGVETGGFGDAGVGVADVAGGDGVAHLGG